jgi:alpha-tubulin suppressor-like RCC1 family protein
MRMLKRIVTAIVVLLLAFGAWRWWLRIADRKSASPEKALVSTSAVARPAPQPSRTAGADDRQEPRGAADSRKTTLFSERPTVAEVPESRFRHELEALPPAERERALEQLGRLRVPLHDVASLSVDRSGRLYYRCALPNETAPALASNAGNQETPTAAAVLPATTPPVYHSRAGAPNTIFLDFNGHRVTGTHWNEASGSRPAVAEYVCRAFDLDGDATTFSEWEQLQIKTIWARVAEDYLPFDVDVTTEEPAAFNTRTARVLITRARDANGVLNPEGTAGGVAYLDVFGTADYAAYSPVFVYFDNLQVSDRIAEAASHETGHNLALSHDGWGPQEYYSGHGSDSTSWGPIMGAPYYRLVTQWSKGEYYNSTNPQDDIAILRAALGSRPDLEPGTRTSAAAIGVSGGDVLATGSIDAVDDEDWFVVRVSAGPVSLIAGPCPNKEMNMGGANSDLTLEIFDESGTPVASGGGAWDGVTFGRVDRTLAAGTYYLRITANGAGSPMDPVTSGYTSYGSLGGYRLSGTISLAPVFVTPPSGASASVGDNVGLKAVVNGSGVLTYEWRRNGVPLLQSSRYGGSNTPELTIYEAQVADAGEYSLVVTNSLGSATSTAAVLSVAGPEITAPPATRSVFAGDPVSFHVSARGTGELTYVWRHLGTILPGSGADLTIASATVQDAGFYQVEVSDGSRTTRAVFQLHVRPAHSTLIGWGANDYGQATLPPGLGPLLGAGAAGYVSVALKADGTVVAWGVTGASTTVPPGLTGVAALSSGGAVNMALQSDGTVVAWGVSSFNATRVPTGLDRVVAIANGSTHSLALRSDGTVVAWGVQPSQTDYSGQTRPPPGLTNVVAIGAGEYHSLALKADGTVVTWGQSNGSPSVTPPAGLADVVEIAAGGYHNVVRKRDGTVVAWGQNFNGQCTIPTTFTNVVSVAAGLSHTVLVNAAGAVSLLGNNYYGQCTLPAGLPPATAALSGNNNSFIFVTAAAPEITRQPVGQIANVGAPVELSVGVAGIGPFTYRWRRGGVALADDTRVSGATTDTLRLASAVLGDNGDYDVQVSNAGGTTTATAATLRVVVPPVVDQPPLSRVVRTGAAITLAASPVGQGYTYAWRRNGQVIVGATGSTLTLASAAAADAGTYVVEVTAADGGVAFSVFRVTVVPAGATVLAWGNNANGEATVPAGLIDVVAVAAGGAHSLALLNDGSVRAWGLNQNGQATVPGTLGTVSAIAAGSAHSLALRTDGTVVAWGSNSNGQCSVPTDLNQVVAIAAGTEHSLALRSDGTVVGWGGPTNLAVPAGLRRIVAISTSGYHALALRADGTVVGWGSSYSNDTPAPVGLSGVAAIACARYFNGFSIALKSDGTVVGWGSRDYNVLSLPSGLANVASIVAGGAHVLARRTDGTLVAWGRDDVAEGMLPIGLDRVIDWSAGTQHNLALVTAIAPTLLRQPASCRVPAQADVVLTVKSAGSAPLAYQWLRNGQAVAESTTSVGTTTAQLVLKAVSAGQAGSYTAVVRNAAGTVTSSAAAVSVADDARPVINVQPLPASCGLGGAATFSVTAAGAGTLTYQWFAGESGDESRPVVGGTGATLNVSSVNAAERYWVRVTNAAGSVNSRAGAVLPWVARTAALGSTHFAAASYAGGRYFVSTNGAIGYSTDGVTWTKAATTMYFAARNGEKVAFGNGRFVAGGGSTTSQVYVSQDGSSWNWQASWLTDSTAERVLFDGAKFLAAGRTGITTSSDTTTWVGRSSVTVTALAIGNRLVAVGNAGVIAVSSDGVGWEALPAPTTQPFRAVAYGAGCFAAVAGTYTNELWISDDGLAWEQVPLPKLPGGAELPVGLTDVAGDSELLAIVIGKHLLTSHDGRHWALTAEMFPSQTTGWPGAITAGPAGFLFAGDSAKLLQAMPLSNSGTVAPLKIRQQPSDTRVAAGQAAVFAVDATAGGPVQHVWQAAPFGSSEWTDLSDGEQYSGTRANLLVVRQAQLDLAGTRYRCRLTNGTLSLASDPALLAMIGADVAPTIARQPPDQSVALRGSCALTIAATGSVPIIYAWQWERPDTGAWVDLVDDAQHVGTHRATLTLRGADYPLSGRYRCVVANPAGTQISAAFRVTVVRAVGGSVDLDGDGVMEPVWRNTGTLELGSWTAAGDYVRVGQEGSGYEVMGYGDFDGDGRSEAVWRHTGTRALVTWPSAGGYQPLGTESGAWQVLGLGDFDGDGKSEFLWRHAVTAEIATWTMAGAYLHLGNESTGWQVIGVGDIDGDGKTEPVWRQSSTTEVGTWTMAGAYVRLGVESGGWDVIGLGDFDGDGKTEPLWRDRSTRDVATWTMAGAYLPLRNESTGWTVIGTGDYDGDGKTEPLWRQTSTQEVGTWTMAGAYVHLGTEANGWVVVPRVPTITSEPTANQWLRSGAGATLTVGVSSNPAAILQWQVSGDGSTWADVVDGTEYAGAGTASLTIANATRAMNGNRYRCVVRNSAGRAMSAAATLNVSARACVANDLDGDGKTDLLWKYTPLQELGIWNSTGFVHLGTEGTGWVVIGVGDFDADGKMELVWRHSGSGQVATWPSGGGYVPLGTESAWQVIRIGDFDGDGRSELLWRHSGTGQVVTWTQAGAYLELGAETDGWRVIGIADFDGDGRQEPAWRNTNSSAIQTTTIAGATIPLGTEGGGWTVTAFGDIDGDGNAEPFWRHASTLENVTWTRAGGFVRLGTESSGGWHVVAVGDYDGDGKSEPLWQHETTRELATWPSGGGYLPLGAESGNWTTMQPR